MVVDHPLRVQSRYVESSAPFAEKITDEPVTTKTAQSTVTCVYRANIAGNWHNATVVWSKNIMNYCLTLSFDSLDSLHHHISKIDLKPWNFWSKKGYKSFEIEGNLVDVYWDLRSAKFSTSPEPSSDYYVALVCNEEVMLLLGDLKKKAYKKTKSRPALADAGLLYKKEHVFAKKSFSTRALFDSRKKEHDIIVESSTSGPKDPEMWISIDGIILIHVKNLQWKFRGNQTVQLNKQPIQVFWDVHDWLFSTTGTGHGLFIFKPLLQESESDRDGASSLGGSSIGASSSLSADSNNSSDKEDFFGPVSASFIKLKRVSDSAASDENHEVTMDSTAFSMHFRSLARSESGGDLKTPTGISVGSEDKTPMDNASEPGSGSSMFLTRAKKLLFAEPVADDKASVGGSGDMSLVGNDTQRYDYGKLSPTLEALLAEGRKDVHPDPSSSKLLGEPGGSATVKNISDIQDVKISGDAEMGSIVDQNVSVNTFSEAPWKLHDADAASDVIQTPNQITKTNESSSHALEYGNATYKPPPTGDKPSDDLQVFAQSTSQHKSLTHDHADEDSIKDYNTLPSKHLNIASPYSSPLVASMYSSHATAQKIFDDTAKFSGHPINTTPSPKVLGPLSSNMSDKHGGTMSSILKGISELKSAVSSPYASLLSAGSERSRHESWLLKDDVIDNNKYILSNHANGSVYMEDRLWNFDPSNSNHWRAPTPDKSMDINRTDTPNKSTSMESLKQGEELRNSVSAGDALQNMHVDGIRKDLPTELAMVVSSSRLRMLTEKAVPPISTAENQGFPESGTESPYMDQKSEIITGLDDKLTEHQGNVLGENRLLSEADDSNRVANKRHKTPNSGGNLSALVDKMGNINQSRPTLGYSNDLMTGVADRVNELYFRHDEINTLETLHTPSRSVTALNFQIGSVDRNFRSGTGPSKSVEELRERLKILPGGSVSSYINKRHSIGQPVQESSCREEQASVLPGKESTVSPIIQESQYALRSDKMQHHFRNFLNQNSKEQHIIDGQKATQILQSPIHVQNIKNSAQNRSEKRKHAGKYVRTESTSEVNESRASGLKFVLDQSKNNDDDRVETRAEAISIRLPDILSKVTESTEQLLSPIVDKLDVNSIDMLEDTLDRMQRGKEHEMRCSDFQSQKAFDGFNTVRLKRTAETKMMVYKIIYENAKVQLLRAKRERLQNNIQNMNSAIQECQSLKLKLGSETLGFAKSNLTDGSSHSEQSSSEGQHAEDSKKLTLMRQNIGGLEQDIKNLTKSFHNYLKMDGVLNSVDTLAFANDHLKMRFRHKLLRQKLQLWEEDGFEVSNGHESIVLNYHGFIRRRFTISSGPTPSFSISDKSNDDKMRKNFPNMDACTAFSFVMNSENMENYVGSRGLTKAAQITNSVFQNLLDVFGEVQLAHLQVKGLSRASFHSPSDQQLNLHLCFTDFTSCRQLSMTLDMTCLNRGIYPSEAVPYQIHERLTDIEKLVPSSLSAELRAAFQSLRAGYSRILTLCRCVSQVLQSSSWW